MTHTFTADTVGDVHAKVAPSGLRGRQWGGYTFDSYRLRRDPTGNDLLYELKSTAWTCASLNAQACAGFQPKLYVTTNPDQPLPKCNRQPITKRQRIRILDTNPRIKAATRHNSLIEEITSHPLLTLLKNVNPIHNAYDLWELTTLYQEVDGSAYWFLNIDPVWQIPTEIWIMPSQNMTPKREQDSQELVDYYEYRSQQGGLERFSPDQIIHFRYPDPRDPYTSGLSPLRACFEQVTLSSEYAAFKTAKFNNFAIPDAILSPNDAIGDEERQRLELEWNQRLRRGGAGRVIVAEQRMRLDLLSHTMGDLSSLADMEATKELIMNAFHIPVAFFSSSTNMANLEASRRQHAEQAILPRVTRRDEKINEKLIPLYDPSGRLFVSSQDPTPVTPSEDVANRDTNLRHGIITINEARAEDGLPPVPWGAEPWLPLQFAQTSVPRQTFIEEITTDDLDVPNAPVATSTETTHTHRRSPKE